MDGVKLSDIKKQLFGSGSGINASQQPQPAHRPLGRGIKPKLLPKPATLGGSTSGSSTPPSAKEKTTLDYDQQPKDYHSVSINKSLTTKEPIPGGSTLFSSKLSQGVRHLYKSRTPFSSKSQISSDSPTQVINAV